MFHDFLILSHLRKIFVYYKVVENNNNNANTGDA